jgi:methylase of polypeptide subunit release factors
MTTSLIHGGALTPLQDASVERLAPIRALLADVGFTESAVCSRVGAESIYDFNAIHEGREIALELNDQLDVLIRLFMDAELVERAAIERILGAEALQTLEGAGFIATAASDSSRCHGEFLLYPTASLWIASDFTIIPGEATAHLADDAVYPAASKNTRHFLSSLPKTPCENFLELCAGTGIAALVASKYSTHTWATDITARATAFARLNIALNGITNCSAAQGDLYDAVPGQTFDRIAAHPPYMPSLEQKYIFRDGGDDGEQVTRRIIAGLSTYLRPGGRFYGTCILTERTNAPVEQRLRAMLGDRESEFDVLVLTYRTFDPTDYYFKLALQGRASLDEVVQRHEIFRSLSVEQIIYSSMVIERHAEPRPSYTARRQVGQGVGIQEVDRLMAWKAESNAPHSLERLVEAPLLASPHARMRLEHALEGDRWVAKECLVFNAVPFVVEAKVPAWSATIIARADGQRTTRDHLDFLKKSGVIPAQVPELEFAQFIRSLVDGGFLLLSQHPAKGPD